MFFFVFYISLIKLTEHESEFNNRILQVDIDEQYDPNPSYCPLNELVLFCREFFEKNFLFDYENYEKPAESSSSNEEEDNFRLSKQDKSNQTGLKSITLPFEATENFYQFYYGNKDKIGLNSFDIKNLQNFENNKAIYQNFTNFETNEQINNFNIDYNHQLNYDASLHESFEYKENFTTNSKHPIIKTETQIYLDDLVPLVLSIDPDYYNNRNTYQ